MAIDEKIDDQQKRLEENLKKIRSTVVVMSGKGGVGKSTVAVNIACGYAAAGRKVGLLDVDIHGPNVPKMLGIEDKRFAGESVSMEPVTFQENLKVASLALAGYEKGTAFIWRGPMKYGVIKQLLADVEWGDLDVLVVDTPPGTGDEVLAVCQLIGAVSGAVIVTTPQDVSVLDAERSVRFAEKLDIPVLGIIENMSGYSCPHCGELVELFGIGGGQNAAGDLSIPFLGALPFLPEIVKAGDCGRPVLLEDLSRSQSTAPSTSFKAVNDILAAIDRELMMLKPGFAV